MAVSIITQDDLHDFKVGLLEDIEKLLEAKYGKKAKRWMKTTEIVEKLGISVSKLQKLRINGTFAYTKIDGMIFYDYEEIMKVFEKNRIKNKV